MIMDDRARRRGRQAWYWLLLLPPVMLLLVVLIPIIRPVHLRTQSGAVWVEIRNYPGYPQGYDYVAQEPVSRVHRFTVGPWTYEVGELHWRWQ